MPAVNLLIVAVDGLRASALGAYGNTTYSTPAIDRFAAESFLFDSCFALSTDLQWVYRALWTSRHPLRPKLDSSWTNVDSTLARRLAVDGYHTTLISDEPVLLASPLAAAFDETVEVEAHTPQRAEVLGQTELARIFATARHAIEADVKSPRFVWVHSRGMYGPWDAPLELQESLLEEGDPNPVEALWPPDLRLAGDEDPDVPFRYNCAYGAQVMALDACWEGLISNVSASNREAEWLVVLVGTRGFPLGEHGKIGGFEQRPYANQMHVPWLIRFVDARGEAERSSQLVSHVDLLPTVCESIEMNGSAGDQAQRVDGTSLVGVVNGRKRQLPEALVFEGSMGGRAIRTQAWSLIYTDQESPTWAPEADVHACELYVRPDDRWESNDIAARCPEVAQSLKRLMDEISTGIERGESAPQHSLPPELSTPSC